MDGLRAGLPDSPQWVFDIPLVGTTVGDLWNRWAADISVMVEALRPYFGILLEGGLGLLLGLARGLTASPLFAQAIGFPSSTSWFNPPADTYGFQVQLFGNFTLVDGAIVAWALSGSAGQVGCGGGPGCLVGGSGVFSSLTSDSSSVVSYNGFNSDLTSSSASNDGGGLWTEEIATSVPEPSTWAMLLIGFAAIGYSRYRRFRSPKRCADYRTY